MRKDLLTAAIAVAVFTVLLGVVYPLAVTGIAQLAFPGRADGSQVRRDGRLIGSRLLAQDFRRPVLGPNGRPRVDRDGDPVLAPDPRYFQPRPSQTTYDPSATAFANLGPNSTAARDSTASSMAAYLALERRYTPGLTAARVPVDAVTSSASGVDPHISRANADIQARRIAAVRRLPLARVLALVRSSTDGRGLGLFGEPGVNVLELDLALDAEARR